VVRTNAIAFTTANYVARETGYAMRDWAQGDRATRDAFASIETYAERFDTLLADIQALGFDTIDVWGAHLHHEWATDAHIEAACEAIRRRGLRVATYATWIDPANIERACEVALALGTEVIGGGCSGDAGQIAAVLARNGVRVGIENHPEATPAELRRKIIAADEAGYPGVFGTTIDTGWWGTQGYDASVAIEELADRLLHVHLKDVRTVSEPHETCRWGDGIVPIEKCVRTLQRLGYAGAIVVEHEPETFDPTDEIRAMRAQLEQWLA
jgi:sugar phosphate isomerase/epimerase